MTKKKANTSVATITPAYPVTKKDVPDAIKTLQKQLDELQVDAKDEISLNIDYDGTNIQKIKTVKELLEISASIHSRAAAYEVEVKRYDLKEDKIQAFSQSGKTVKQWENIIRKALNEVVNSAKITKLKSAIEKLSKHLDEDTRLQNELAEIMTDASNPID